MSGSPLLELDKISKSFPGVKALSGVSAAFRTGEVHALMGENGAGKSTLIKVLTGVHFRDEGTILLNGTAINPRSPHEAQLAGISTVYQEVNLIPHLSVAENISLGRQRKRLGLLDWKLVRTRATEALSRLNVRLDVTKPLSSYSIAIQQLVAIARALDISAKVLILDEPTSSLDAGEVNNLFAVLRRLKSEGLCIIFVSHFLDQVYAISDRMTILRNGKLVGEYATAALPRIELIARMLGKETSELETNFQQRPPLPSSGTKKALLEVEHFGRRGLLEPFNLRAVPGEVLGLAGLLGSGRSELARLLFGVEHADSGTLRIEGAPRQISSPRSAIGFDFAFCGEDRKVDGIIPNLSVRENIVLALQGKQGLIRKLSIHSQNELAGKYIRALNIATPDAERPIKFLSGGNQQKALLARWLASNPRFLILDEPTRGIDVGAKFEIEKLISSLTIQGLSILCIASELEELARTSHRVLILRDRKVIGELSGDDVSASRVMQLIADPDTADIATAHPS